MTAPRTLRDAERAELYLGLGRALSAGLDAEQALLAAHGVAGGSVDGRLRGAAAAVSRGTALSIALRRQGLVSDRDLALVAAGDELGTVDRVLTRLSDRYARSAARWRQMRGRLLLPAAVLVIGLLVLPLPAVAAGRLSVTGYVLRTGALLALLAFAVALLSRAIRRMRARGAPAWLTSSCRSVPGLARLSRLHERADVCERLSLALEGGLAAREAFTALRDSEPDPVRRATLGHAHGLLVDGTGVAEALHRAGVLDAASLALVHTGEAAGRLPAMLERVAQGAHDALDGAYDTISRWVPVGLYLLVVALVAGAFG